METFLLNLLKTSLLGSLAILAMLVLKPLWRERYRAKTRCWLWLALAVFLLLPIDFSVKNAPVQAAPPKDYTLFVGTDKTAIQSTDNLFGNMAEKSGQSPAQVRDTIIQRPVTNPEQKTTRYIPVTTILFYGYLAGAAAFLLYQGVSYALFRRTVRRWKRDVSRADYAAMLSDTARDLGVSAPEMIVCEAISTPAPAPAPRALRRAGAALHPAPRAVPFEAARHALKARAARGQRDALVQPRGVSDAASGGRGH